MAMAVHLPVAAGIPRSPCTLKSSVSNGVAGVPDRACFVGRVRGRDARLWRMPLERGFVAVRASESSAVDVAVAGGVTEVDKDSFRAFVEDAGEKVVVLDMYTQWCGPCKLMYPKLVKLSETYAADVAFAKLDCNQENKPLAKELGVKSVPTFKIFKKGEEVGEVRGAKYDDLVRAIEKARSLAS